MASDTVNKNENRRVSLMFDCFLACVLFFGTDAFLEFTTDTYRTFAVGVGKKAKDMLVRNGRPVIALYYKCFGMTGLPQEKFYYISSLFFLIKVISPNDHHNEQSEYMPLPLFHYPYNTG